GMHHRVRKKRFKEFRRDRRLYRQRGIAEAVFGGIENRYGAMVRCRLPATKAASVLLMAVAHNLRTLARVRAMKEIRILLLFGFIRQTRYSVLQWFSSA
ncbi:MAG: hypothetical protein ABH852_03205, partial [Methanobacteriota archaeon]